MAGGEVSAAAPALPAAPPRVVILGSVTRDVIHRHARLTRQIGGSAWFAGTTLAGLGLEVTVLTRLAAGERAIAAAFADRGIATRLLPAAATTVFHNIYGPGGRDDRRQRVEAVAEPIPLAAVRAALRGGAVAYLGALHPADLAAAALRFVCRRRGLLAMDVQGFTRRLERGAVSGEVAPVLTPLLAACRMVKASAAEACLITGARERERAARQLAETNPGAEVLVTCGADGALLAIGDALHRQPAAVVADPDPTGAGDIFLAAYLARRLGGAMPADALAFAVAHAARRLGAGDRIVRLTE